MGTKTKQEREELDRLFAEAKTLMEKVLAKPILPSNFKFSDCALSTPLDKQVDDSPISILRNPAKPMTQMKSKILDFIRFCFGPLEANPNNPGNIAAQRTLYTFPPTSGSYQWEGSILNDKAFQNINRSDTIVEKLAQELSDLAQENRYLYEMKFLKQDTDKYDLASRRTHISRHSKILLIGTRGSGKTVFINYLMSAKHHIFTKNKVLWFRIDLTRGNFNLQEWMRWQMLHVLFKYYDETPTNAQNYINLELTGVNTQLRHRISHYRSGQDFGESYPGYFDSFKNRLKYDINYTKIKASNVGEEDDFSQTIPASIFKGIWDYLTIDKQLGILFVIDGLDQLGLTEEDSIEFNAKLEDVRNYILNPEAEQAAYLITMRFETYQYRARDLHESSHILTMEDVDPYDIIKKRIDYMRSGNALLPRSLMKSSFSIMKEELERLAALCEFFIKFVTVSVTRCLADWQTEDPRQGMKLLNEVFNRDRRKLFLAIQSCLSFFFHNMLDNFEDNITKALSDEFLGRRYPQWMSKYYLVVEGWLLDHHSYHVNRYMYYMSEGNDRILFDRGPGPDYLPNIYKHPIHERLHNFSGLVGTRILQLLYYHGSLSESELIPFLCSCFHYDKLVVECYIKELIHDGVIKRATSLLYRTQTSLQITQRGKFVVDRLMGNIEYINLALQTAGIPSHLMQRGYFKIFPADNRAMFTKAKVINSIDFLRLLRAAEEQDRRNFNNYKLDASLGEHSCFNDYDESYDNYGAGIFRIFERYIPNIIDTSQRILAQAAKSENDELLKSVVTQLNNRIAENDNTRNVIDDVVKDRGD